MYIYTVTFLDTSRKNIDDAKNGVPHTEIGQLEGEAPRVQKTLRANSLLYAPIGRMLTKVMSSGAEKLHCVPDNIFIDSNLYNFTEAEERGKYIDLQKKGYIAFRVLRRWIGEQKKENHKWGPIDDYGSQICAKCGIKRSGSYMKHYYKGCDFLYVNPGCVA